MKCPGLRSTTRGRLALRGFDDGNMLISTAVAAHSHLDDRFRHHRQSGGVSLRAVTATRATSCSARCRPVELVVWGPGYADTDAEGNDTFSKVIDDRFEELYPNVTVTHEGFDFATLETRITTAMAAQEGPDVFSLYFNPQFYRAMIPLNGYLDDESRERIQYLSLSAMDAGSLYFMPYQSYAIRLVLQQGDVRRRRLGSGRRRRPGRTWYRRAKR